MPPEGSQRVDVAVVGAGHNALAAAAYLARAGHRTRVFEQRPVVGGACVTEELWPGYRVSRAAYLAGLLRPALVRELALRRHGLRLLPRNPASFTPLPDGRSLLLGSDRALCLREVARFSERDAARLFDYEAFLGRVARVVEPLLDAEPPEPGRLRRRDLGPLLRAGWRALRLREELPRALEILLGPARPILEAWLESEPLRGTLATDALIGAWAGPGSPGTGYVLLHHVMGETGGERGVWAYVEGGMGGLSEALAAAAREAGAVIETEAPVERIRVEGGRARGLLLADGREVAARAVVSGADPRLTLLGLVGREALPEGAARELENLDFRSPSLKINLALDRLPAFPSRPGLGAGPHHRGTIHVGAQDLDALETSFRAAEAGELPERPMIELTLPSVLDPGLAPAGHHVAGLFVQHVPWDPRDAPGRGVAQREPLPGRAPPGPAGSSAAGPGAAYTGAAAPGAPPPRAATGWDAWREPFADRVLALLDEVSPGFSQSVVHREVLAPPDLEAVFGLTGGNIFHGAMTPDRLHGLRPRPGWGYATPVPGLYLCGAGTHPGGGVMGACGRNAAARVARDLRGR